MAHPLLVPSHVGIPAKLARFASSHNSAPPPHLGTRYTPDGVFLPEPGNTVVCHVPEGSQTQAAIVDVRRRFMEMPQAHQLAFTPVSSLHMTLSRESSKPGVLLHTGRRALPRTYPSMP